MRWLRRDFLVKLSVIVVTLITVVVCMNIVGIVDKYVSVSLTAGTNSNYEHSDVRKITYANPREEVHYGPDIEYKQEIKEDIKTFLKKVSECDEFEGNVTLPLIYLDFGDGLLVNTNILLSHNEKLPYIIDSNGYSKEGLYIGNSYDGYWNNGKVKFDSAEIDVAGVIKSTYLELNNEMYIPYKCFRNDDEKTELYGNLINELYYDKEMIIMFCSNREGVIEHDIGVLNSLVGNDGVFVLKDMTDKESDRVETEIEFENNDNLFLYKGIKNLICYVAVLFCILAVFETLRLYIKRKRADIMIMWSLGARKVLIFKMLLTEVVSAVLTGTALAFICEGLIYGIILKSSLATVFVYGLYAFAVVAVLTLLMILLMLFVTLRKPVISVIKSGE